MLASLHIRDFAIVRRLDLEFRDGLTVLTGETGAGKSILIDALTLLLGARAETGVVRADCPQAEISASFTLAPGDDAAIWLAGEELAGDDPRECILRRVIYADRPTRGFINGRPVPMAQMRLLGDQLVDVHGQHEHQSLLKRETQRQILDDFAGAGDAAGEIAASFHQLRELEARLDALKTQSADRDARQELLRFQADELEALGLEPGENSRLEEEHARLAHASELIEGLQSTASDLYDRDEGAASSILNQATARLEQLTDYDPALAGIAALVQEAAIRVDEAAGQLHQQLDRIELDPGRLAWLEERLGLIHGLTRKHQAEADELPPLLERLRVELEDLDDADNNLERLASDLAAVRTRYFEQARALSAQRRSAATTLSDQVGKRMAELGMPGGQFQVAVEPLPEDQPTRYGLDRIEFQVSANPGQPLRPLTRVASGGELSRISLAVQVIIAAIGRIPTLIFDEVDVGIGGRVAEIVGQRLRGLGSSRQVLCITHLAQVAAQGTWHLAVRKQDQPELSVSISELDDPGQVEEIARMIGGVTITEQTRAHARDMLTRAGGN
ncbi:MAG: DNA repair protein RecN [Gammaproteobacteria bacterium]|nr:DNA repair protein RecN [Gammaproteobacteria bacterium]